MDNKDYSKILEQLPKDWYSEDELRIFLHKAYLDHVRYIALDFDIVIEQEADISRLYELLAEESNTTIEEVEQSMMQAAQFVARLMMFDNKFPHIVAEFPTNEAGQSVFPADVLSIILNISMEEARLVASNYWGTPIGQEQPSSETEIN